MGNKIVTEADRKRTPAAPNTEGYIRPQGTGQRVDLAVDRREPVRRLGGAAADPARRTPERHDRARAASRLPERLRPRTGHIELDAAMVRARRLYLVGSRRFLAQVGQS